MMNVNRRHGLQGLMPGTIAFPYNPITASPALVNSFAPLAGNALTKSLTGCGSLNRPCFGVGSVTLPFIDKEIPGETWMYAAGIGLIAGIYFMSRGKG